MSYITHLLAGWMLLFMQKIWPGRWPHWVKYRNINNSDLDGMSLASFCQSWAEYIHYCSEYMLFILLPSFPPTTGWHLLPPQPPHPRGTWDPGEHHAAQTDPRPGIHAGREGALFRIWRDWVMQQLKNWTRQSLTLKIPRTEVIIHS